MKRLICMCVSILLILITGCEIPVNETLFYCTQERVCDSENDGKSYDLSRMAVDTGILIPGLKQNFIPQGICCVDSKNLILLSGYFAPIDGPLSAVVLALDMATGKMVGEYTLIDSSGRNVGGHFSGIAATRNDLYITGGKYLYRVPLSELSAAGCCGALKVEEQIDMNISADACNYSGGELWVCEYYQPDKYPLDGSHRVVCDDQTMHHAWMLGYAVEDGLELKCIMSIPDKIQGITKLADGRILMSQSYGRKNSSEILLYSDPRSESPDAVVEMDGENVPLWHLDGEHLLKTLSAPPMSEGCCATKEGAYLLFESAAYYYSGLDSDNRSIYPVDTIWHFLPDK